MFRRIPAIIKNFNRGVNDTSALENLRDDELLKAVNIELFTRGGFSIRQGVTKYNSSPYAATPISRMLRLGNTNLLVTGSHIKKWDGTNVQENLNSPNISYGIMNKKLYYLDGTQYWVWDGVAAPAPVVPAVGNTLSEVKKCKIMVSRARRFYFAGNGNDIIFTDPGKANDVGNDLNVLQIVPDDNDEIRGMTEFHGALVIFKDRHVYGWFGTDPAHAGATIKELGVHDGAVAHRTIVKTPKGILCYLSGDGVMSMMGVEPTMVKSSIVSKNISNFIKTLTNLDKACAVYYKERLLIACCDNGTGVNNKVLVGYPEKAYMDEHGDLQFPWVVWDGLHVNEWYVDIDRKLYYGDSREGNIYRMFEGYNDAGEVIPAYVETPNYSLDTMFNIKKVKQVLLSTQQFVTNDPSNSTVTVKIGYREVTADINFKQDAIWGVDEEDGDEGFEWDEALWGWEDAVKTKIRSGNAKGHSIKLIFNMNSLNNHVTVYGIGIQAKLRKIKGVGHNVTITEKA